MSDRILVDGRIAAPIIWNMKGGELIKALFFSGVLETHIATVGLKMELEIKKRRH